MESKQNTIHLATYLRKTLYLKQLPDFFYNGPKRPDDPIIANGFVSHISNNHSGLLSCKLGFGPVIETLTSKIFAQHIILYNNNSIELELTKDTMILSMNYSHWRYNINNILSFNTPRSNVKTRRLIYHSDFVKTKGNTIKAYLDDDKPTRISFESKDNGLITICPENDCPDSQFRIIKCNRDKLVAMEKDPYSSRGHWHTYEHPLVEEIYCPNGCHIQTDSNWLIDELWNNLFDGQWIPFEIEERISSFPEAAHFFHKNYPHVIPTDAKSIIDNLLSTCKA